MSTPLSLLPPAVSVGAGSVAIAGIARHLPMPSTRVTRAAGLSGKASEHLAVVDAEVIEKLVGLKHSDVEM